MVGAGWSWACLVYNGVLGNMGSVTNGAGWDDGLGYRDPLVFGDSDCWR